VDRKVPCRAYETIVQGRLQWVMVPMRDVRGWGAQRSSAGTILPLRFEKARPSGRPLIQISDLGLSSMDEAGATIYHEIYHHRSYARGSGPGEEAMAEAFGQRMLAIFNRRR
jgi:hypothetical protein